MYEHVEQCQKQDAAGRRTQQAHSLPVVPPAKEELACVHRGLERLRNADETLTLAECTSCQPVNDQPSRKQVYACSIHGTCIERGVPKDERIASCLTCENSEPRLAGGPSRIMRIDLPRGIEDGHWNCSILEHGGRMLMATRMGWTNARVFLHELDADFKPLWSRDLGIKHAFATAGAEDPRLVAFDGDVYLSFSGYEKGRTRVGGKARTSILVAKLDADLRVDGIWVPHFANRNEWEKNWALFEHAGQLWCVYSINPHVVLRMDGPDAIEHARVNHRFRMLGSHLRGGAPPVRVGNEFYHWFHTVRQAESHRVYGIGLYTFDAATFRPTRAASRPLWETAEVIKDWDKRVVFPCGAIKRGDEWLVSYGHQDRECRIAFWDHATVEKQLKVIK